MFGAAEAGAFPTLSRALSRWFPIHERSRANGIMWMGARSGGALAPPLAVAIIALVGWRYTFAIFGAGGIDLVRRVCVFWYRDDPADHPSVNSEELRLIRSGAAPPPQSGERRAVEDPAAQSHDDRAVLQLFRFGVRISVLRHLAAHVPHARTRFDAATIRRLCGAAAWRRERSDA